MSNKNLSVASFPEEDPPRVVITATGGFSGSVGTPGTSYKLDLTTFSSTNREYIEVPCDPSHTMTHWKTFHYDKIIFSRAVLILMIFGAAIFGALCMAATIALCG